MTAEFNLPGSSFEEVQKILKGYNNASDQASLDDLAKMAGLHRTGISRNNKFLTDLGLIAGGRKKSATELGKRLGRALEHGQEADAQKYWKEAIQTNEKISGLVTTVRIQGGMTEKAFSAHILYVSGQANHSANKTGARCVVDVLLAAKLLMEENGKVVVSAIPAEKSLADEEPVAITHMPSAAQEAANADGGGFMSSVPNVSAIPTTSNLSPQIAINIQLHLPETENAEVYAKLFNALREHLLSPKD